MTTPLRTALRIALPVVLLLAATTARADDEPAATAVSHESYRMQLVAADAASVGLVVAAGLVEGSGGRNEGAGDFLVLSGLAGFALGAPAVHLSHGEPARAGISLAARLVLPVLGAYIGAASATCNGDEFCGLGEGIAGFMIGAASASILDATLIASIPSASAAAPERPARSGASITPRLVATQNVAMVGVGGSF